MANEHKDLTGQTFGRLTVTGMVKKGVTYHAVCRCTCGNEKTVAPCNLRARTHTEKSCGCIPRSRKPSLVGDLIGQRFGYLQVVSVEQVGKTMSGKRSGTYYAVCHCSNCGNPRHAVLPAALRRGATTSCGCRRDHYARNSGARNANFKGYGEISSRFWRGYVRSAEKRGIPFNLTLEDTWGLFEKQGRKCALSGAPLAFGRTCKNSFTTASIDRVDASKGYVVDNIQWVHKKINIMKHVMGNAEFIEWCRMVSRCQSGM